eukprot:TRINITY_DN164_c0_g1_i37.p2 TRINITY_DN164_c0_g1~~TRINITY_DN164_c0_g1_i37.p2  ORF type:complete len:100 (-),score=15.33 TRINITY_DN164_c0_g1_i37:933-1232(-)
MVRTVKNKIFFTVLTIPHSEIPENASRFYIQVNTDHKLSHTQVQQPIYRRPTTKYQLISRNLPTTTRIENFKLPFPINQFGVHRVCQKFLSNPATIPRS